MFYINIIKKIILYSIYIRITVISMMRSAFNRND
nr:MAG TPA: hypothetical protein [Caudoviricetes sp.]